MKQNKDNLNLGLPNKWIAVRQQIHIIIIIVIIKELQGLHDSLTLWNSLKVQFENNWF